jgi:hypothetical protein
VSILLEAALLVGGVYLYWRTARRYTSTVTGRLTPGLVSGVILAWGRGSRSRRRAELTPPCGRLDGAGWRGRCESGERAPVRSGLLWLNLSILLTVSFMPFPTAVLGARLEESDNVAVVCYAASMTVSSIALTLISACPSRICGSVSAFTRRPSART